MDRLPPELLHKIKRHVHQLLLRDVHCELKEEIYPAGVFNHKYPDIWKFWGKLSKGHTGVVWEWVRWGDHHADWGIRLEPYDVNGLNNWKDVPKESCKKLRSPL